jgi:threonine/homoserine/homoserine lactone efflux protein
VVINVFLKGLLIGLAIAAPVGPIGILCIRRSLTEGRMIGLVSGLGAASGDAIYGFLAAFGLTLVTQFMVDQQAWIRLVGGVFLCYLGVKTFIAPVGRESVAMRGNGLVGAYASTLILTLTNPMTILAFTAIFAGLGISTGDKRDHLSGANLVAGVFSGSALWWLFLSQSAGLLRTRLGPESWRWINRISGLIIVGFGIAGLVSMIIL